MNEKSEGDLPAWAAPLAVIVVVTVLFGIVKFWPGYHREHMLASPDGTWIAEWTRTDLRERAPFRVRVVEQGGPDHLKDFRMIAEARCPQATKERCSLRWTQDSKNILVICAEPPHTKASLTAPGTSLVWLDLHTGRVKSKGCEKVQTLSLVGMRGDDSPLLSEDLAGRNYRLPIP
jgi:hypothetical protein